MDAKVRNSSELTFEALLQIGKEIDLVNQITLHQILQICEKSTASNINKCLLWLETLLQVLISSDQQLKYALNDEEWMEVFTYLEKIAGDAVRNAFNLFIYLLVYFF